MPELTSALPPDIGERADAAFVVHVCWALDRTPGMTTRVTPELVLADSGLACDTYNFICRARLPSGTAMATAQDAIAHFTRSRRPFSWWVGPADQPGELGDILEALGLRPVETELAMGLPLDRVSARGPEVPGLEVRRVRTRGELEAFAELSAANWTPPDPHVRAFYRRTADAFLGADAPQWLYLGYLDRRPAATAEASVAGGTVQLFSISTLPAFRGRGIASRMTWQPLRDARAAGCDVGVLQAAPEGVGVYRRLGFVPFGDITEYKAS
jgi:ribosomal protein S18 acetylase RimI-like enzyme